MLHLHSKPSQKLWACHLSSSRTRSGKLKDLSVTESMQLSTANPTGAKSVLTGLMPGPHEWCRLSGRMFCFDLWPLSKWRRIGKPWSWTALSKRRNFNNRLRNNAILQHRIVFCGGSAHGLNMTAAAFMASAITLLWQRNHLQVTWIVKRGFASSSRRW